MRPRGNGIRKGLRGRRRTGSRCGECGGPVTAERQRRHVYYHCTRNRGPCSQTKWTREEALDAQFCRLLQGLRLPQPYLDYAFAKIVDNFRLGKDKKLEHHYAVAQVDDQMDPLNFPDLLRLKKEFPKLKTLIAIGGWTLSDKFSPAIKDEAGRTSITKKTSVCSRAERPR